ncbi:MAG TPA: efflux RND transporter permease subunit, partial [Acidimicrobiales bacterium]
MEDLKAGFPQGLDYKIVYDTTPFIRESIYEVFTTLRDALILVAVVVLVFLQNWRAALIPLVAVPVAVVGTFAAMAVLGYSLNNLSLFGLVLAIGIVVDDAIVVVENVERVGARELEDGQPHGRVSVEGAGQAVVLGAQLDASDVAEPDNPGGGRDRPAPHRRRAQHTVAGNDFRRARDRRGARRGGCSP